MMVGRTLTFNMAELLIRVKDSYPLTGKSEFDAKASRRGDVIVVKEDGWSWGDKELSCDFWRIVKIPGVPAVQFAQFISSEKDTDPLKPKSTLLFRMNKFDIDMPTLPKEFVDHIADDTRVSPAYTATFLKPTAINTGDIAIGTVQFKKTLIPDPLYK